jgi:glycosyltransferase involved in cell wall biosynthesis
MPRLAVLHYALGRFGGAAKIAILQAIYLNKMGFDVELFYGGPILDYWKKRAISEILVNPLPLGLPKSMQEAQKIIGILKKLRAFDVILVSHGICPFFSRYLTMFLGHKVVWYCGEPLRALWEDYVSRESYETQRGTVKPTSKMLYGKAYSSIFLSKTLYDLSIHTLRTLDKKTVGSYRKIMANSYFTRKVVKELYKTDYDVPVVHPGVDVTQYANVETSKCLASDFILAVGAMIPMKNHVTLLRAFKRLPAHYKSRIKLLIIGDGPMKSEILSMIRDSDLQNVELRTNVTEEELLTYYTHCRFVVHIALYEPFGLVPLEAALFGKTSIVSNLGGTKEFVIDGETGILVDPHSTIEIANAIVSLIDNSELAHTMGSRARKRALTEFTMETSSKSIAKILKLDN